MLPPDALPHTEGYPALPGRAGDHLLFIALQGAVPAQGAGGLLRSVTALRRNQAISSEV